MNNAEIHHIFVGTRHHEMHWKLLSNIR
jgi:hypothetical protein